VQPEIRCPNGMHFLSLYPLFRLNQELTQQMGKKKF
jgi:hypothetical protein